MVENYINLLKNQISKLESENLEFVAWKSSTLIILGRIFGETSLNMEQMNNIKYTQYDSPAGPPSNCPTWDKPYYSETRKRPSNNVTRSRLSDNLVQCIAHARGILDTCIIELENFGLPEIITEKTDSSQINIIQTQNQNQTVDLNLIISSIEDELTRAQSKEIRSILKSTDDGEEKKSKLINRLGEFGSDLASKVLANILTNPQIVGAAFS